VEFSNFPDLVIRSIGRKTLVLAGPGYEKTGGEGELRRLMIASWMIASWMNAAEFRTISGQVDRYDFHLLWLEVILASVSVLCARAPGGSVVGSWA
jgi:hypothetical protein